MRKGLLIAAFLGSTFMTAKPAKANPVIAFVAEVVASITAGFTAIGGALGLSVSAAAAFGAFGTNLIVGIGLNALTAALMPSPSFSGADPGQRMTNYAQPVSYVETVVGECRKGGPLGFTGFANNSRYYVPIFAAHPIDGIEKYFLDEREVTFDESHICQTEPIGDHATVIPFTGQPGQVAEPMMLEAFPELTEAHDFAGLSGAYVRAKKPSNPSDFSDIYPNGREWAVTPLLRGHNGIYDPRDDTYKYTNNAALVLAHWVTQTLGRAVVWDAVAIEADYADETVLNKEGELQPRWTLNGVWVDNQEAEEQRAQLGVACDAFFYERPNGAVGFKLGRYEEPTVTLTDEDFISITATSGGFGSDAPTAVAPRYIEPENLWRDSPAGKFVLDASVREVTYEPSVLFCNTHNQVSHVAKRLAHVKRPENRVSAVLKMSGFDLIGERFVRIEHSELGISGTFEVDQLAMLAGGGAFSLEALSTAAEHHALDASTEEPERPTYGSVEGDTTLPDPSGVNAVLMTQVSTPVVRLSWEDDGFAKEVEIKGNFYTSGEWVVLHKGAETSFVDVQVLADGEDVHFRVRNISGTNTSGWVPDEDGLIVEVILNSTPPAALVWMDATSPQAGELQVDVATANDENQYRVTAKRSLTNDIATAVQVDETLLLGPNQAGAIIETSVAAGSYYIWAVPVNSSGVEGAPSGPVQVTVA